MKKNSPHKTKKLKFIPWIYCWACGLVYLKNEATARAIKASCPGDN